MTSLNPCPETNHIILKLLTTSLRLPTTSLGCSERQFLELGGPPGRPQVSVQSTDTNLGHRASRVFETWASSLPWHRVYELSSIPSERTVAPVGPESSQPDWTGETPVALRLTGR